MLTELSIRDVVLIEALDLGFGDGLGVPVEAEKAGAVLGRNYPGTDWYQHAYDLLKKNQVPAVPPLTPGEQVVPVGTKGTPSVQVELDEPGSTPTGPAERAPAPRSAGQPSNTGS